MLTAVSRQEASRPSNDERAATCALAGLGGIGNQSLELIRSAFGSLAAAVARGGAEIATVEGLRADGATSLRKAPDLARRGLCPGRIAYTPRNISGVGQIFHAVAVAP